MKYVIISGSNRKNSGSRKVADFVAGQLVNGLDTARVLDLSEEDIAMWTADMWDLDSEQTKKWKTYSRILRGADAIVVVAAEWAGSIPPSLRNFFTHMSTAEVAHKPALIVSVSGGRGGAYPISELRSFSVKNNHLLYIPDHVIVRNVGEVLHDSELVEENKEDYWIKTKLIRAISVLRVYAKNMNEVRRALNEDFEKYPYGM